jgi:hypothetical protein
MSSTDYAAAKKKEKLERLSQMLNELGTITHSVASSDTTTSSAIPNSKISRIFSNNFFVPLNSHDSDSSTPGSVSPTNRNLFSTGNRSSAGTSPSSSSQNGSLFMGHHQNSNSNNGRDFNVMNAAPRLSKFAEVNETLLKARKILAEKPKERAIVDENDNRNDKKNNKKKKTTSFFEDDSDDDDNDDLRSNSSFSNSKKPSRERNEVKEKLEKLLSVGNATENFQTLEKSIAIFFGGKNADSSFFGGDNNNNLSSESVLSRAQIKEQEEKAKYQEEKQKQNEALFRRHHARCEAITAAGVKIERVFSLIPLDHPRDLE